MDEGSARRESFIDCPEGGQFFPVYGEGCQVKILNRLGVPHDRGDCFAAITGSVFLVSKYRLVGKTWYHAIAIFAGNVLPGKDRVHPRMSCDERLQISEAKLR